MLRARARERRHVPFRSCRHDMDHVAADLGWNRGALSRAPLRATPAHEDPPHHLHSLGSRVHARKVDEGAIAGDHQRIRARTSRFVLVLCSHRCDISSGCTLAASRSLLTTTCLTVCTGWFCWSQAIWGQFFQIASLTWNVVVCINLFLSVFSPFIDTYKYYPVRAASALECFEWQRRVVAHEHCG